MKKLLKKKVLRGQTDYPSMNPSDKVSMIGILKFLKYLSIYPFALICRHAAAVELLGLMEESNPDLEKNEDFKSLCKSFFESSKGDFESLKTLENLLNKENENV